MGVIGDVVPPLEFSAPFANTSFQAIDEVFSSGVAVRPRGILETMLAALQVTLLSAAQVPFSMANTTLDAFFEGIVLGMAMCSRYVFNAHEACRDVAHLVEVLPPSSVSESTREVSPRLPRHWSTRTSIDT